MGGDRRTRIAPARINRVANAPIDIQIPEKRELYDRRPPRSTKVLTLASVNPMNSTISHCFLVSGSSILFSTAPCTQQAFAIPRIAQPVAIRLSLIHPNGTYSMRMRAAEAARVGNFPRGKTRNPTISPEENAA